MGQNAWKGGIARKEEERPGEGRLVKGKPREDCLVKLRKSKESGGQERKPREAREGG